MGTGVEEETADKTAKEPVKTEPNDVEFSAHRSTGEQTGDRASTLSAALQVMQAENEKLKEKNLTLLAEIENLRIRQEREKRECAKNSISGFARELLVVADGIRRTIETVPKELAAAIPAVKSLVEGVEVTERAFLHALGRFHITRFHPLGEPFNPHYHIAKIRTSVPNVPSNTVIQVVEAGYSMGDQLLRPAAVIVAQNAAKPAGQPQKWTSGSLPGNAPPRPASAYPPRGADWDEGAIAAHFRPQASNTPKALQGEQQAGKMHHKPAVLHKPVISATEGVPAATHPIWERLVTGQVKHKFKMFAANMLIDRAKREYANNRSSKARLANEICTFFNRYAQVTAAELQPIVAAIGGIPAATHPIWEKLVTGQVRHKFKLFAANMLVDRAKREYANNRAAKTKLVSELCEFFNGHADLIASEIEMVASKDRIWLN